MSGSAFREPLPYTGAGEFFYADNVQISGAADRRDQRLYRRRCDRRADRGDCQRVGDGRRHRRRGVQARVVIGNFLAGDTLTWSTGGTSIVGSYDSATGILSLSGTDTRANYQAVLNSIRYLSTSDDPTVGGTLTNRAISVTVRDSDGDPEQRRHQQDQPHRGQRRSGEHGAGGADDGDERAARAVERERQRAERRRPMPLRCR